MGFRGEEGHLRTRLLKCVASKTKVTKRRLVKQILVVPIIFLKVHSQQPTILPVTQEDVSQMYGSSVVQSGDAAGLSTVTLHGSSEVQHVSCTFLGSMSRI